MVDALPEIPPMQTQDFVRSETERFIVSDIEALAGTLRDSITPQTLDQLRLALMNPRTTELLAHHLFPLPDSITTIPLPESGRLPFEEQLASNSFLDFLSKMAELSDPNKAIASSALIVHGKNRSTDGLASEWTSNVSHWPSGAEVVYGAIKTWFERLIVDRQNVRNTDFYSDHGPKTANQSYMVVSMGIGLNNQDPYVWGVSLRELREKGLQPDPIVTGGANRPYTEKKAIRIQAGTDHIHLACLQLGLYEKMKQVASIESGLESIPGDHQDVLFPTQRFIVSLDLPLLRQNPDIALALVNSLIDNFRQGKGTIVNLDKYSLTHDEIAVIAAFIQDQISPSGAVENLVTWASDPIVNPARKPHLLFKKPHEMPYAESGYNWNDYSTISF